MRRSIKRLTERKNLHRQESLRKLKKNIKEKTPFSRLLVEMPFSTNKQVKNSVETDFEEMP